MTFTDWVEETRRQVRQDGWRGVKDSVYKFYVGIYRNVGRRFNYGRPIYEEDWDLLVVLDACRADLMAEVADEYGFVDEDTTYSVGSSSAEWLSKNFTEEYESEMARTAYVTANPHSDERLDDEQFAVLEEVWRNAWDDELGTIPAEAVTDAAIVTHRETDHNRLLVHYMQPHHPFVDDPMDEGIPPVEYDSVPWDSVWHRLRRGEVELDEVWEGYRNNLRYVLDSVETLLENVDAEDAVITSDHGNLVGELGMYAHPDWVPLRPLKRVPWSRTSATDTGSVDTETARAYRTSTGTAVEKKLQQLGYRE